jgi:hypothetical protein
MRDTYVSRMGHVPWPIRDMFPYNQRFIYSITVTIGFLRVCHLTSIRP